jgi:hypothetical protein
LAEEGEPKLAAKPLDTQVLDEITSDIKRARKQRKQ